MHNEDPPPQEIFFIVERLEHMFAFDRMYKGGQGGIDIRGKYREDMNVFLESTKYLKISFSHSPQLLEQTFQHENLKKDPLLRKYLSEKIHGWFPQSPSLLAIVSSHSEIQRESTEAVPSASRKGVIDIRAAQLEVNEIGKFKAAYSELLAERTGLLEEVTQLTKRVEELTRELSERSEKEKPAADTAKNDRLIRSYQNLINTITGIFSVMFMNKKHVSFSEFSAAMQSVIRHIRNHNKTHDDRIDIESLEFLLKEGPE
ncbi:MAG: hypothetical protein HY774_18870 [Acidobacteria bacterium]|nr:hypothetical protein [Acidobacteriota bacterium]